MFNFEKLETWHRAIAFADLVCEVTRNFPGDERVGMTNQMRRAAVSISSNIADGTARLSKNNCARFWKIAAGSLYEVVSQSFVGQRPGHLSEPEFKRLHAGAEEHGRRLSGLRRSVLETS